MLLPATGLVLLFTLTWGVYSSATIAPCDVSAPPFRAACNNVTEDTAALQAALDEPACETVVVPRHCVALTRGLNLTRMSGRALRIEGVLQVWPAATYGVNGYNNPVLAGSYSHAWNGPLLHDFSLSGGGTVFGGGAAWWPAGKSVNRPRTLWLPNASNVVIANLTLVDSPAWNIGIRGTGVRISGVTVAAGADRCGGYDAAPNTDGFNLGGEDIEVRDCVVHNGDDWHASTLRGEGPVSSDTGRKKAGCEGITTVESVLRGCMTISEGQTVPEFSLSDQDGATVTSAQLRGGWAVVYFYPKDDTPGCTAESCSFRDNFEAFTDAGAKVIGISSDAVESHKAFAQKHTLPFTLLADTDSVVRKQFGVSKTLGLLPGRVTYVIDPNGIVRKVFSSQFKPKKHIDEALAVISKS